MKNIHWLILKPASFVTLGCIWISVVQCIVLKSCLKSCIMNLGLQLDIDTPFNLSEACIQGCQFWSFVDQENCALKCNDTYATICERESCKAGCSSAEGAYEEEMLGSIELPTAPVASSIGSHSVTLRWKSANISGVKYIIQWKYVQLQGSWTYTETMSKLLYVVKPLHPFTEYVFRVVWIFRAQLQLYSPPSRTYRTHPYGVPETAPSISNIESSSPNTVEVSWVPPQFQGGPILGYNLRLISKNQKLHSGTQRTSFQFYSTLPNTTYRFSVAAVNEGGEGPEAVSGITTPSTAVQEEEHWLFLSRKSSVRKRSLKHLVDEAHCLWSDAIHHNITGISVNFHQQIVYFSEGTLIWVKEVANMSDVSDLRISYRGSELISSISIDWLYQRMYFIMNELVYVCDLENCSNLEEITPLSLISPQKVVADSYNGYVFYLLRGGIYRVNLPGPAGRDTNPVCIVESCTLKDFVVKPQSKRIIYFNDTIQVFMSTFLDGSDSYFVLPEVPPANVKSFACENNDFLVTDGKAVFQQDSLSFNEFTVGCDLSHIEELGFGNLVIFGSSTQPHPLPGRPQELSVLFGSHQALVQWKPLALAIGTSLSAWQNWTYEVKVSTQGIPEIIQVFSNISGTKLNVPDLQSATKYRVSVRASSPKGPGPWSEPSVGTTLVSAAEPPLIMAVKEDGLWSKLLDSFDPAEFLSSDIGNVSDMDWYNNSLYYSDMKGDVYVRLLNGIDISTSYTPLNISGVGAFAFEWLGHFLYWAGKTYMIQRQSVLTGHTDIVTHVKLLVNDIVVDSIGGYLYWTTLYSVESTRLNGENPLVLQEQPWLSGQKVIALTLDLSDGLLYWMVQDSHCIHLYTAILRGQSTVGVTITEIAFWSTSEISQNALMYYSGRLFWINGFKIITAQEIGQKSSVSISEPAGFNQFIIIQRSLKPLTGNFSSTLKVIPGSVQESSFRIEGRASSFQILWNAPSEVDWGIVLYSVEFSAHSKVYSTTISNTEHLYQSIYNEFRLYWTEVSNLGHQMFYCSIINHTLHQVLQPMSANQQNGRRQCYCNVTEAELSGAMAIDTSDLEKPWIYFTKGQEIWVMDLEGCQCWTVIIVPVLLGNMKTLESLTVDGDFIYWIITGKDNTEIYQAKKSNGAILSQVKTLRSKHILAYSPVIQPFPDKAYLLLASDIIEPMILNASNTSLTLRLPPVKTNLTWHCITSSTPTYLVYYSEVNGSTHSSGLKYRVLESQENIALIGGLQPFSTYIMQIAVKNYYSSPLEHLPLGKKIWGKTKSGVPGAVGLINTTVLSDTSLHVSWKESQEPNGPKESVRYQLRLSHLTPIPETPVRQSEFPSSRLAVIVTRLSGGQLYVLKVLACHSEEMWYAESFPVTVKMFDMPMKPYILVPGNTSLQLGWKAPLNVNLIRFWFELQKGKYNEFYHVEASCSQGPAYVCNITDLQPYISYSVQVVVVYMTGESSASLPESFKTKVGVPSKPGIPKLLERSKNSIQWAKAEDNGSRLTYYILEIRKVISNDSWNQNLRWKMAFNGSCNSICTWKSKTLKGTFQFRVVAANNIGFGEYSGVSENLILVEDDLWIPETSFIFTIVVGIFLVAIIPLTFVWHRRLKSQKHSKEGLTVLINEDRELAKLQSLAAGVGLANACCAVHTVPTQEEIENLPIFPRENLTLHLLLGSGAFGEVYKGIAVDILGGGSGDIKVAVKTLKKGSTEQEKVEFLKEAHMMSKFNHPNILKQLGVCLLNEPQYIILELMEGGDLLSYLRKARRTTFHGPLLTLVDLVDLCVDISKGCVYLEQMHFIHRDLAARNCLVSVKDYTSPRIVKIGDFGLAREIYKNDYYRKRGEGLLPVRWMAPESLMDGIFTTQSDIWSFRILAWEILTLGHQPYPAHSNLVVLNYVQAGGRLEPPRRCPHHLWNLLTQCWAQEPDQRPTFHKIQDQFQLFSNVSLNTIPKSTEETNTMGVINEDFGGKDDNMASMNSGDFLQVALMETKNPEGLSYMVLATEGRQGEENSEGPLGSKESGSYGLRKEKKEPDADQDFCQEQVAYCPSDRTKGLNYACLTHSGHGDGSD
uniref:proto-oncogene tyrosine-protein kinase ROS n=1 Tax=Jaculus jaculus TaxID=51337 RepID=UPI001E1B5D0D|nr:proto-oncogene tyrosine-protein kinase ROS [Jaculus jaculus]